MWFWQECTTAVHCILSTPVPSTHCKEQKKKQLSINNQHIRVPRWCAFNFAQVLFQCMLGMPSNSGIKAEFKKNVHERVLIFGKKACSPAATSWMQVIHTTHWAIWLCFRWNVARIFSTSSSSTHYRTQSDHRINSQWQTWSWRMMGLWCWVVDMSM